LDDFIVFEGIDGSGTTTQIALLKEALRQNGAAARVFFSAEPSSAATGTFLRSVLSGGVPSAGGTRAYLFAADRFEHLYGDGGVVAALNAGKAAVSDRYFFSSLAYQGIECGRELPEALNRDFPLPRYLFFFDIDAALAAERLSVRATAEIYENRAFLEKAVSAYRRVVGEYEAGEKGRGMRVVHIDASRPKVEIAGIIWNALQPVPAFRGAPALPCLF
jgi:dTMP kinase